MIDVQEAALLVVARFRREAEGHVWLIRSEAELLPYRAPVPTLGFEPLGRSRGNAAMLLV
jgi:hypothetical protein